MKRILEYVVTEPQFNILSHIFWHGNSDEEVLDSADVFELCKMELLEFYNNEDVKKVALSQKGYLNVRAQFYIDMIDMQTRMAVIQEATEAGNIGGKEMPKCEHQCVQ